MEVDRIHGGGKFKERWKRQEKALNRRVNRKENRKESPNQRTMESLVSKERPRTMAKAKQVGSHMTQRVAKAKAILAKMLAFVVVNQGILPKTAMLGGRVLETFSMRVNNYPILKLHILLRLLQVQQPVGLPAPTAHHSSQQLNSGLPEFMNVTLSFKMLQMFQGMMKLFLICAALVTSPSRQGGSVRVMRYYIGDELRCCMNGSVRAVIETMPDDSNMCSVLLDSGADASIFPACMAGLGTESDRLVTKLQDAQGNVIPLRLCETSSCV